MSRALRWTPGYRIIRTIYPPVDLFEDIADPADWELLVSAEAKLNPRIRDKVGNLAMVPVARRITGPTASIAMGAFTHVSVHRASRFSDGSYGVWYCGDRFEVALAETAHHFQLFMQSTGEPPGDADYRVLTAAVVAQVEEAPSECMLESDWRPGQAFGRNVRARSLDGIVYPSLRYSLRFAAAIFWPDCLSLPITQSEHLRYRWDGTRMTHYLPHGATAWTVWPISGVPGQDPQSA